jgi:TPR repeat protein
MKSAENRHQTARRLLAAVLMFSGFNAPLMANEMWESMFKGHLENARAGDPEAQYEVGIMYLKGQGVDQNRENAIEWLKAAAASGYPLAEGKLSRIEEQEVKFEELKEQADKGNLDAQYDVAMMYLKGRGVASSGLAALRYLQKAADEGDERAIARLGIINYKGEVGDADYEKALALFRRVSGTSVLAQYYLGEMYASGAGVGQDYATAIDWYKKAAEGGFNRASGKIINLEEEIKTEQRRKLNVARAAQQQKAAPQPAPVARKPVVPKPVARTVPPARPVVAEKPVRKPARKGLDKLADNQWLRDERPVDYLPSRVTRCDRDDDRLVCFSEVLHRNSGTKVVEYRVKSIISADGDAFDIIYRNLVLDVTDSEDPEDQPLGYDHQLEKGYHVKTGWTSQHRVVCRNASKQSMDCAKDDTYQITLVAED